MKKQEYIKPAVRVRPLITEGSVMDTIVISGESEMEGDTLAKEHNFDDDFDYPEGKSVWED